MQKQKYDMTMLYEFIILVALIVIVALLVFSINEDARDDITDMDRTTTNIVNESNLKPTPTGITLASSILRDGSCGAITTIYNGTSGVVIGLGNITQTDCVVVNATSTADYASNWLYSYSVEHALDSLRYNSTLDNDTAVAKIPKSLKLLATAIIFGAVLFVILKVIPFNKGTGTLQ